MHVTHVFQRRSSSREAQEAHATAKFVLRKCFISNRWADLSPHPPQVAWVTEPFNPRGGGRRAPRDSPAVAGAPLGTPQEPATAGGVGQTREPNSAFRRGKCCPIFRFGCEARVAEPGFLTWNETNTTCIFHPRRKNFPPAEGRVTHKRGPGRRERTGTNRQKNDRSNDTKSPASESRDCNFPQL